MVFSAQHNLPPILIWNGSASAPLGAYLRATGSIARGDYVVSHVPSRAQLIVNERHYLPAGIPVLKRIAAMAGDRVCREEQQVSINGKVEALALTLDSQKRPMPHWQGCVRLKADDVFLLLKDGRSFDGRYFGVTSTKLILGKYYQLWTYDP